MNARTILWRRLDQTGLEVARLEEHPSGWSFTGTVIVVNEGTPCAFTYAVVCDSSWRTVEASIRGTVGEEFVNVSVESHGRQWLRNGEAQPQVAGCIDVDIAFTPATNTLPIRRLRIPIGQSVPVTAAWLRFPDFVLVPLEQSYTRERANVYRYESGGGSFAARIDVDDLGLVRQYGQIWRAE
ncbi:MAG TPA: putative glycolipid-binding domain-containing protein [Gemmatimonadaceae bacterium]|nr:putative glycolipid-binding domain-containing protein [Gemmatimonadaceae bacterium]